MTDAQKFGFYLPVWNRCALANSWKMLGRPSRLVADLDAQEERFRATPGPGGECGLKVLTFARQIALQEHRGVIAEDLRRACTLAATGKLSSKHLNNTEVNKLVALLRLLINPDHLKSVDELEHPEIAAKRGLIVSIKRWAPEGLLGHIFSNAYGTKHWEDGTRQQLVWLLKQVKGRQQKRRTSNAEHSTSSVEREPELAGDPF